MKQRVVMTTKDLIRTTILNRHPMKKMRLISIRPRLMQLRRRETPTVRTKVRKTDRATDSNEEVKHTTT